MFSILMSGGTVTYGPGLTMAPGYIHYGPGFVDCMPVVRPPGSDAAKNGFGLRAVNTDTARFWQAGEKVCGRSTGRFSGYKKGMEPVVAE